MHDQKNPHTYPNHPTIQKFTLPRGSKVLDVQSGQWIELPADLEVQGVPMIVIGYSTAQGPRCYGVPATTAYPGERQPIFQPDFAQQITERLPIIKPAPGDAPTEQPSVDPPEHPDNIYDPARLFGSR